MNRERMEQLLAHLQALPHEEFDYSAYFKPAGVEVADNDWIDSLNETIPRPRCGTAGCVAGHTCMLFRAGDPLPYEHLWDAACDAQRVLELSRLQSYFLFLEHSSMASLEDAIRRLQFLLEYPDLEVPRDSYPWHLESWSSKSMTASLETTNEP